MPENPVKTGVAAKALGVGATRMAAIKRRLGITGPWVLVSQARKFLAANPNFSERDVYHPASCACAECRGKKRRDYSKRKPPARRRDQLIAAEHSSRSSG